MKELIDRIKTAESEEIALDREIGAALGLHAWDFTGSIDDAVRLIPEGLYWVAGHGRAADVEPLGGCLIYRPGKLDREPFAQAEAATVPLAICAAALSARQKLVGGDA